ncbi:MAG: carboxypeptidase-like regulatory domain-containing protein, partial [Prevotellaceae bacterium]|nr:carboxypeptidase-like regulatory domain-containing protein [Prevotellaceae bacterium]
MCLVFFTAITYAADLRGTVVENRSKEPLIAATILVINEKDTTSMRHVSTDNDGAFIMRNLSAGSYKVSINYLGYSKVEKRLSISNKDIDMGTIQMRRDAVELDAVQIKAQAVRATQRGDTTEFNAEAYKVTQDASAEDLIKKLPGITVEGGTVKTQGEDVRKVLVDGKPFFGDDPTIAIRNLPAEVIDKIEVFDRMSDQSQLTGFDDGESVKTLNIVTKENRRTGQFGRVYAGSGYDDTEKDVRYSAGGNISLFNNIRRVSIIGMSNNVNQQNFASEDLSAVSGGGRGRRNAFSGGGSGIVTTHAIGINYSDMWGEKVEVSGSYFFNYVDKNTRKELAREYFSEGDTTQYYNENSNSDNETYNNRLNFKLDYKISEQTSLMFQPSLSFQTSSTSKEDINEMLFNTVDFGNQIANSSESFNNTDNKVFNFNNELLLRHKFQKQGRTFSVRIRNNIGDAKASNTSEVFRDSIKSQQWDNPTNNGSANGNVTYTEPLSKSSIIQVNYDFNYSHGESNKKTYNLPGMELDSLFSNIYNNNYITHKAGGSYRYRSEKSNLTLGINYQMAMLDGAQIMPQKPDVNKSFSTILPMARFDFKFSRHQTLRFFYRTSTSAPSINQLQN